ncbi:MAG: hypothetical protein COA45_03960 [Zetaproteobacteria bacterium]|nr:MAG: hypothetical protein COA45_03960 [Zetaproteobacteria bacterium]
MLLDLIARHESGGMYNRVYGRGVKTEPLTSMSINNVMSWQRQYTTIHKSRSSAAGRYQIIRITLIDLTKSMRLSGKELFNEEMQDRMAMELLKRRGYRRFLLRTKTLKAMVRSLSQEWASFPKDESGKSYYAGDGLNKALVSYDEVIKVLKLERERALTERLLLWRKENV